MQLIEQNNCTLFEELAFVVRPETQLIDLGKAALTQMALKFPNRLIAAENSVDTIMIQTDGFLMLDDNINIAILDAFSGKDPIDVAVFEQTRRFVIAAKKFYERKAQILTDKSVAQLFIPDTGFTLKSNDTVLALATSSTKSDQFLGINGPKQVIKLKMIMIPIIAIQKYRTLYKDLPKTDKNQCYIQFYQKCIIQRFQLQDHL